MVLGAHGVSKVILLAPLFFFLPLYSLYEAQSFIDEIYFLPEQGTEVLDIVIEAIDRAETAIYTTQFRMSNKRIVQALCDAADRGVIVEIVIDQEAITEQLFLLLEHDITVYIYRATQRRPLMHNKMFLFLSTFRGFPLVISGSLNMTDSGIKNRENVTIRTDEKIIEKWKREFKLIKEHSHKFVLEAAHKYFAFKFDEEDE